MERIQLTKENVAECAEKAAEFFRAGGVVLYPTDTLYGLGADALSDASVAKIYATKGREERKPIHAIVSDIDMVGEYADDSDDVRVLIERLPQGQVTYIVKKKSEHTTGIMSNIGTFGFRIPDSEICTRLVQIFGSPITATSANKSGEVPERSVEKILAQLGKSAENIDLIIDAGELPEKQPSTVVDLSGLEPVILREGAVSSADVWSALREEQ